MNDLEKLLDTSDDSEQIKKDLGIGQVDQSEKPKKRVFQFLSFDDILNLPPKQWIIDGIIGYNDLVMLYGESNKGKTFVALDLIVACLTGGKFANKYSKKLDRVCYMTGEGRTGLQQRINGIYFSRNITKEQKKGFIASLDTPQLFQADHPFNSNTFIEEYKAIYGEKLDLLIIDTLHNATVGLNENSSTDAGVVLERMRYLQKELNCTIIIVHHANKGGQAERGSTAYRGAMDSILEVRMNRLVCSKQKDASFFDNKGFSILENEKGAYLLWDDETQNNEKISFLEKLNVQKILSVFKNEDEKLKSSQLQEATGLTRSSMSRLLSKMTERNLLKREKLNKGFLYSLPS